MQIKAAAVPIQIIFCLKETNQGKINSHRWFFNAFGPVVKPHICMLLEVGTVLGPTSIYYLWKAFDIDSKVGGARGDRRLKEQLRADSY
jgi:chitin synthase